MTSASVCATVCGDGYKTPDEGCDDFNLLTLDGCGATCLIEPGWTCAELANGTSVCTAICGDS